MRNVLVNYIRKGILTWEDCLEIMDEATELMRGGEYEIVSADVLRLASRSKLSAYDCEFVALAQDLNVPLVTVNVRVVSEFPEMAISLQDYADG